MKGFWKRLNKPAHYLLVPLLTMLGGLIILAVVFTFSPSIGNAFAAIGTIVAAMLAAISIIKQEHTQTLERKERLLNETIQWATLVYARLKLRKRDVHQAEFYREWTILSAQKVGITGLKRIYDCDFARKVDTAVTDFDEVDKVFATGDTVNEALLDACMKSCDEVIKVGYQKKAKND